MDRVDHATDNDTRPHDMRARGIGIMKVFMLRPNPSSSGHFRNTMVDQSSVPKLANDNRGETLRNGTFGYDGPLTKDLLVV